MMLDYKPTRKTALPGLAQKYPHIRFHTTPRMVFVYRGMALHPTLTAVRRSEHSGHCKCEGRRFDSVSDFIHWAAAHPSIVRPKER
jgi:hypothetical protein